MRPDVVSQMGRLWINHKTVNKDFRGASTWRRRVAETTGEESPSLSIAGFERADLANELGFEDNESSEL